MYGYAHMTNLRAMAWAKALHIPVLVRAESQAGGVQRSATTTPIKEKALPWLFKQVDGFLAIGSENRAYYRRYGVSDERIWSMPYTVDNTFFQERIAQVRPERERLRASLGLTPGRPIILYVSKLTARKRAADLLDAYVRLSPDGKQEPIPYLLFVGSGETREALEAKAASFGWSSIRFLGFKNQSELPAFFDLCDVFVLVSENEQWGLVINEVMNAGKPVIVSEGVGAASDLVSDGKNGFIVPVGDVATLSNRLTRLTTAEGASDLTQEMGKCSRQRIDTWSFKEDLAGLEAAVTRLCSSGKME